MLNPVEGFSSCSLHDRYRSLNIRIAEHKKVVAVAGFDQNSKVASHLHHFSHNVNFEEVKVVGFEAIYPERLFFWTRTLVTTISYFQKPTKASRQARIQGR